MVSYALPLIIGFFFALTLQKAGLAHYDKIINQFRFKDNTIMKYMMTGISTGLIGLYLLSDLGLLQLTQMNATYVVATLIGGLIFGVGMALAGT
jgi:uncharacterized membrane protein YedE/YeeE